jgi:hypothetical protein
MAGTFERTAEEIERHTETSRGSSERERETERERERERIEADAGADTKTTTKMRKRINTWKKNKKHRDPHVAQRAPKRVILAEARTPRPNPNLNLNILERPDER